MENGTGCQWQEGVELREEERGEEGSGCGLWDPLDYVNVSVLVVIMFYSFTNGTTEGNWTMGTWDLYYFL